MELLDDLIVLPRDGDGIESGADELGPAVFPITVTIPGFGSNIR